MIGAFKVRILSAKKLLKNDYKHDSESPPTHDY